MKHSELIPKVFPVNNGVIHKALLSPSTDYILGGAQGLRRTPEGLIGPSLTAYGSEIVVLPKCVWINGEYLQDKDVNPTLLDIRK